LTVFLTVFFEMHRQPKPKDRQIERIALTVFSIRRRVLENALEGAILCLFGAFRTMERQPSG
jgi:hypothetical protein